MRYNNPYKGVNTYKDDDSAVFWGRDKEIKDITNLVVKNNSVVLTGYSGCGKSSLIHAGLNPNLKDNHSCYTLVIIPKTRFELEIVSKDKDISYKFIHDFFDEISDSIADFICKYKITLKLKKSVKERIDNGDKKDEDLQKSIEIIQKSIEIINAPDDKNRKAYIKDNLSLWQMLFMFEYENDSGLNISFAIVWDQFEILFQNGLNMKTISCFFQIHEILCGYYRPTYNEIANIMKVYVEIDEINKGLYVSMLDLIFPTQKIYDSFRTLDMEHCIVISIRNDYMFDLQLYSNNDRFPFLLNNMYFVEKLNEEQAIEVIVRSKRFDTSDISSIKNIISFLIKKNNENWKIDRIPEYKVDTMMLSLLLYQLCEEYVEVEKIRISSDVLHDDFNRMIKNFYFNQANDFVLKTKISPRTFCDFERNLISEDGRFRKVIPLPNNLKKEEIENCKLFYMHCSEETNMIQLRHDKLCQYAKEHILAFEQREKNAKRYSADIYLTPAGRLMHDNCYIEPIFGPWDTYSAIQRTVFFMEGGISDTINFDLDFARKLKEINAGEAHSLDFVLGFRKKEDGDYHSYYNSEGFREFKIKIVDAKIYEISFWKDSANKVSVQLPSGYYKVIFYYETYQDENGIHNRVFLKNFYSKKNGVLKRTLINGYTSIYYIYDNDDNLPTKTYYLDLGEIDEKILTMKYRDYIAIVKALEKNNNNRGNTTLNDALKAKYLSENDLPNNCNEYLNLKCETLLDIKQRIKIELNQKSVNDDAYIYNVLNFFAFSKPHAKGGNIGYHSEYDIYGRETLRKYNVTNYGFNLIKFGRDYDRESKQDIHDNLIKSISFFTVKDGIEKKATYHRDKLNTGIHKVTFDYKNHRVETIKYYNDKNEIHYNALNNISGEKYTYNDDFIISEYMGKDEKNGEDLSGIKYAYIHRDKQERNRVDYIEWKDKNKNSADKREKDGKMYSKIQFEPNNDDEIIVKYYNVYGIDVLKKTATDAQEKINEGNPIYISYSSSNQSIVNELASLLNKHKVSFIIGDNTSSNTNILKKMSMSSNFFIILISDNFLTSPHCIYEFNLILKSKNSKILLIKYGKININEIVKNWEALESLIQSSIIQKMLKSVVYSDIFVSYNLDRKVIIDDKAWQSAITFCRDHFMYEWNDKNSIYYIINIIKNWFIIK